MVTLVAFTSQLYERKQRAAYACIRLSLSPLSHSVTLFDAMLKNPPRRKVRNGEKTRKRKKNKRDRCWQHTKDYVAYCKLWCALFTDARPQKDASLEHWCASSFFERRRKKREKKKVEQATHCNYLSHYLNHRHCLCVIIGGHQREKERKKGRKVALRARDILLTTKDMNDRVQSMIKLDSRAERIRWSNASRDRERAERKRLIEQSTKRCPCCRTWHCVMCIRWDSLLSLSDSIHNHKPKERTYLWEATRKKERERESGHDSSFQRSFTACKPDFMSDQCLPFTVNNDRCIELSQPNGQLAKSTETFCWKGERLCYDAKNEINQPIHLHVTQGVVKSGREIEKMFYGRNLSHLQSGVDGKMAQMLVCAFSFLSLSLSFSVSWSYFHFAFPLLVSA